MFCVMHLNINIYKEGVLKRLFDLLCIPQISEHRRPWAQQLDLWSKTGNHNNSQLHQSLAWKSSFFVNIELTSYFNGNQIHNL